MTIAIIGAGPAGSSTAHFLGKLGIKHVLFDKATFPRSKVCGDGLAPKSALMLDRINPEILQHASLRPIWGGHVYAPSGARTTLYLKQPDQSQANAYSITRKHLDQLLLEQRNQDYTTLLQGTEIEKIERKSQGFKVHYTENGQKLTIEVDLLIGADGDRSIVKKTLAPHKLQPDHYVAGIRMYYRGITDLSQQGMFEFYFLKSLLPGYLWIFPMPDTDMANVGLGMLSSDVSANKANLRAMLQEAITTLPQLASRFQHAEAVSKPEGWGLPLGSYRPTISGDGFLLTGDAASLIDPLTGEGVGNALYSGWLAAEAAQQAITHKRTDASFLAEHYDKRIQRTLGPDLKKMYWLSRIFSSPRLLNYILNKLATKPFLQDALNNLYEPGAIKKHLRNPLFFPKLVWNLLF
jgi:menaquinone-9 beta-reductase